MRILYSLLLRALEDVRDQGIRYDYAQREAAMHTLRGKPIFAEIVRRGMGLMLPVHCRFDEHTADVLENQVICVANLLAQPLAPPQHPFANIFQISRNLVSVGPFMGAHRALCTRCANSRLFWTRFP